MDEMSLLWLFVVFVAVCVWWKYALLGLVLWLVCKYGVEPELSRRKDRRR